MHSLDLLHKCHAYVPPLKIWALMATVPTTACLFLLHDLFTAPIPQSHKQQGGLHFQALMVQSLSVTDPFPPLTHSQHVSNTINSIQTASGSPSPLSHPQFSQSCSSHLKHAFASLSCPRSSPTQQPEHFSKLSNLSPCIWNSPVLSSLLREESKLLPYTLQDRTLACVCAQFLPSLFTFLPVSFRGALATFALSSMKRHSTRVLCTCSFLWCFAFLE